VGRESDFDSVSIVDLAGLRVVATLATTTSRPTWCLPETRSARSSRVRRQPISSLTRRSRREPTIVRSMRERAHCVSPSGDRSTPNLRVGNASTILGAGFDGGASHQRGQRPDARTVEEQRQNAATPLIRRSIRRSPRSGRGLIVKKDDAGRWRDDNSGDWTDLVTGSNAPRSGRS